MSDKLEKLVAAGKVSSPHGVRGQVKIYSYLEYPEKFSEYKKFYFANGSEVKIKYHHSNKNFAIVSIDQISDRDEVQKLNGKEIFIKRSQLKKLEENQFYHQDLIGLNVVEVNNNTEIGEVSSIQNFGSGDLIEIYTKGKYELFVFNKENFPEINLKKKIIYIKFPKIDNS